MVANPVDGVLLKSSRFVVTVVSHEFIGRSETAGEL